ncbi:MAG: flavodoxin domain-containing protein, partial [Chloroflexota bacterium]
MTKVGLFFGSNTGNTEINADLIKAKFEAVRPDSVDLHNIGLVDPKKMEEYQFLIVGSPTWNIGELQDDWELKFDDLNGLNMEGKLVAMFGVGDQFGYPDNFCDAIGIIGNRLVERGAELIG